MSDVSEDGANTTVEQTLAAGHKAVALLGGLDPAVNNAGIGHQPGDLHDMTVEVWDRVSVSTCAAPSCAYGPS